VRRPRLVWQLYAPLLAIVTGALFLITALSVRSLRQLYLENTSASLEAQAQLTARLLGDHGALPFRDRLDREVKQLGRLTETRITVIVADGTVVADSSADPAMMDNHAQRPEVEAALRGETGRSTRFSNTVRKNLLYIAVPLREEGRIAAVVRTAIPLTAIESVLHDVNVRTAVGGAIILVLAAGTILWVSRKISSPLEQLEKAATSFANGRLDVRLPVSGSGEMASVAEAMNRMAADLDERIRTVVRQRNEQEAVLSSMLEGVIAVDRDEHVIAMNKAAARLLDADPNEAVGRSVQEVARNPELQRFAADALASGKPIEGDLTLHGREICYLQAHGAPIRDGRGRRIGSVLVLNDVTRLKHLESVRSDFVANVSHELKTPITSIKGFLETLADGAVDDPHNARRFLAIALKQADRLNAIIEDLLSLSRIEQEAETGQLPRSPETMRDVIQGAVEVCRTKAEAKQISLNVSCDERLRANVNAPLLEQAIVNLVDNAIKYSDLGSTVEVEVGSDDGHVAIRVRDRGAGIEAAHLPRLFERFYRVDKARSRTLGGTGLGLAIVKHIAAAHGGTIAVESEPGKGSTFTLTLPRTEADAVRNGRTAARTA
jgi:two-component system phosphate regulon sensor histidine kinase PhoR